jgi:two-component system sensor kinase FixL
MFAWLSTITTGAFLSGGRYDVGWYVGLVLDALTSIVVLLVLLHQTITLYARQFRAAAVERRERERRLKEMEAVLIHLSRVTELGQNVFALAHEVSQPLTAISNYAAACMQLADKAPERVKPLLQSLNEQAVRAADIIRDLRASIAQHESEKHAEDIEEVLERAVRLALAAGSEPVPVIVRRFSPAVSSAFIDRVQIEQVVFNLVRNAIEAISDWPRRTLTLATALTSDGMIEVSVMDTGPGLAPEIQSRLFEPFVTTKPRGLGIGLSICRVIVESHGGSLRADVNPGGGTAFRFTIPQSSVVMEQPARNVANF